MLEFTLRHEIDCSQERFWELFFDETFTHDLIVKGLDFASCDIEPVKEAGERKTRVMRVIPKLDVPAAVAKLLGPKLGYTEDGTFFTTKELWTYTLRLSVLSDRIRMGGKLRIEPIDDTKCRRISELWCEVRILGLGKMVEKAAEKNMRDGWNKSAAWMNEYIRDHPA